MLDLDLGVGADDARDPLPLSPTPACRVLPRSVTGGLVSGGRGLVEPRVRRFGFQPAIVCPCNEVDGCSTSGIVGPDALARKSSRLNSSHYCAARMPSLA